MQTTTTGSDLPNVPAVYAMYGGRGRSQYVAYVGVADKLRARIEQHLARRDSSMTTGTSAAMLNPDHVVLREDSTPVPRITKQQCGESKLTPPRCSI